VEGDLFLISLCIILINFSCVGILLFKLFLLNGDPIHLDPDIFLKALKFTLVQAFLSASASVIVGLVAAPGYSRLGVFQKPARWILLFPSLMSQILIVLGLLLSFKNFPYGMRGIVLGHVFLNGGLCAVWLGEAWKTLEEKWAPVNFVLGGSKRRYFLKIILPQMRGGIFSTFTVVFSFCLSSFAIPLVFGGGPQASTLEVLIYEQLRATGELNSSLLIALSQILIQALVYVLILRTHQNISRPRFLLRKLETGGILILVPLALLLFSALPILQVFKTALPQLRNLSYIGPDFFDAITNSLTVGLFLSLLVFLILPILAAQKYTVLLFRIPTLSGVVVGIASLILLNSIDTSSRIFFLTCLLYGHFCVIFLAIGRLAEPKITELNNLYSKTIDQLGIDSGLAIKRVYLPLEKRFFASAAVLAGIWSIGEFSVSRVLSGEYMTIPVFIETLLSSYRLEMAAGASLILLALTVLSLTVLEGVINGLG